MLNRPINSFYSLILSTLFGVTMASGIVVADTQQKIRSALAGDLRSAEEKARDASRKPLETLSFFGIEKEMKVLELFPGRGWYTKILGAILKEEGDLSLALGLRFLGNSLEEWGYQEVTIRGEKAKMSPTEQRGIYELENLSLGTNEFDMVLTFRNMHNLTEQGRRTLNEAVYEALKSGGIYGVIDHTRRHMEPETAELWRREDPVQIIKELLDAGFEFEAFSDLHRQPKDDLVYDSTHESLQRNSDRFTLKFRKP